MAEGKKSFIAYSDWHGMFKALPDEVAGRLIKHIFSYVNDESPTSEDYVINALFEQVKASLKRDLKKWEGQRLQRSKAGKRSAEIRAAKSNERSTVVESRERKATVSDSVSVSVNVSDNVIKGNIKGDKSPLPTKRFTPPSFEVVKNYCLERGNNVDPQKWIDHYTSNGWKVGRNKMKDWKAAVRTWESNDINNKKNNTNGGLFTEQTGKQISKTEDAAIGLAKRVAKRHFEETGERIPYQQFITGGA